MPDIVDNVLQRLAQLIRDSSFEPLESDTLEIKPVPGDGGSWRERHKSANAFLNTRGGLLLLGIAERGQGAARRYEFTGYSESAEEKLKELPALFADRQGRALDLREQFPRWELREFLHGRVAVVWIDELPADQKYAFYRGTAFKRVLTGDHTLSHAELDSQDRYREEAWLGRELQPIAGLTLDNLNVDALNDFIQHLNRPVRIETVKPDLEAGRSFLERKQFVREGVPTVLGMLVCGRHPEDYLGFCCHVHGYVDAPQEIARDKQDYTGNVLPLMESGLAYLLRNIQVGIVARDGGSDAPEYPEEVLRETVNNALAHRDYFIDKQITIAITPGKEIAIRNPGRFRPGHLIEHPGDAIPLRRIIPEARARNPKLADVLRVFRKWEGRGIGMATLVNLCLADRIDIPTYRLYTEEVCLILKPGRLCCETIETRLLEFDAYIEGKLNGIPLTTDQKCVLAYLMKSEWANERVRYSILLTPDNNHYDQLLHLERCGLIRQHPQSTAVHPIYVVDRVLMQRGYTAELVARYGERVYRLDPKARAALEVAYRQATFSKTPALSARRTAFSLWQEQRRGSENIREFESFYRTIRTAFNRLERGGYLQRCETGRGYELGPPSSDAADPSGEDPRSR